MLGTRYKDVTIRNAFLEQLDKSIPRNMFVRIIYILAVQNWEHLTGTFWIRQALEILLGMANTDFALSMYPTGAQTLSLSYLEAFPSNKADEKVTGAFGKFSSGHKTFLEELGVIKVTDVMGPLRALLHLDHRISFHMWSEVFKLAFKSFSVREQHDVNKAFITLLTRDYHTRQIDTRPNVIQALLHSAANCGAPLCFPPQVVKYLAKTYGAWYEGILLLEQVSDQIDTSNPPFRDPQKIKELTDNSINELYSLLSEDDYYFGSWRRRCLFTDTNTALAFEQCGKWQQAQAVYEDAQMKARSGTLAFNEPEYRLWEERWINCTQKLQDWDMLMDLSKHDNNVDLQLECAWRLQDWSMEKDSLSTAVAIVSERK